MKLSYNLYRFISTFIGEALILTSSFFNIFTENYVLTFFARRSGKSILSSVTDRKKIWFYASSVGEAGVCEILIKEILKHRSDISFHVSLMTDTGYEIAVSNLMKYADVSFSPVDTVFSVKRAIKEISPDLICMIETEIWPNLVCEAGLNSIPVIVVNARVSNSSLTGYIKIKGLLKEVFKYIKEFSMASQLDKENLTKLGYDDLNISVSGNAKYDFSVDDNEITTKREEYLDLFHFSENHKIIVCGSTRPGEEEILINTFMQLKKRDPDIRLVIVPRHLKRVHEISDLIKAKGLKFHKRTDSITETGDIVILNTMGELKHVYSIADIVFTGGSLVDFGGQNPLEPAALAKPVIFGEYMDDFREISGIILKSKGGFQVNESSLQEILGNLLKNRELRELTGENAKKAVEQNRGAAQKQAETILKYL